MPKRPPAVPVIAAHALVQRHDLEGIKIMSPAYKACVLGRPRKLREESNIMQREIILSGASLLILMLPVQAWAHLNMQPGFWELSTMVRGSTYRPSKSATCRRTSMH
jgi:hypothetical protein